MLKVNLFKKIAVSAIATTMCLCVDSQLRKEV